MSGFLHCAASGASSCPSRLCPWLRRLAWLAAGLAILLVVGWFFRAQLLAGLAKAWIVDDSPQKADAIVVLGGGVEYRPFAAARLYQEGVAPRILIMDVALSRTEAMGIKPPERSVTRLVLLNEGVPEDAIVLVGHHVTNTYEESLAVQEWAKTNGARRLLITTEMFHTRRVRWLFRKRFKGTGTQIQVVAARPRGYTATNWWRNEQGLINFQNEWAKLPYYWLKY